MYTCSSNWNNNWMD